MKGLVDTHFHLDHYRNHSELYQYINTSEQYTLCMTNSPGIYISCKKLYAETKYVKFAMGFHPLNTELKKADLTNFLKLLPRVNYIGEIGMDLSKKSGLDRDFQEVAFRKIIEASSKQNKLVSVHVRKANDIAADIISEYGPLKCIIHWFQGTLDELERYLDLGCYLSINANMVVHNLEIVRKIPTERLLVESDGPYTKVNNKKYVPKDLALEYEIIARAIDDRDLIKNTFDNFKQLLQR